MKKRMFFHSTTFYSVPVPESDRKSKVFPVVSRPNTYRISKSPFRLGVSCSGNVSAPGNQYHHPCGMWWRISFGAQNGPIKNSETNVERKRIAGSAGKTEDDSDLWKIHFVKQRSASRFPVQKWTSKLLQFLRSGRDFPSFSKMYYIELIMLPAAKNCLENSKTQKWKPQGNPEDSKRKIIIQC